MSRCSRCGCTVFHENEQDKVRCKEKMDTLDICEYEVLKEKYEHLRKSLKNLEYACRPFCDNSRLNGNFLDLRRVEAVKALERNQ